MSLLRILLLFVVVGVSACSTQPPKVSCQSHLSPINVPGSSGGTSHAESSQPSKAKAIRPGGENAHGR